MDGDRWIPEAISEGEFERDKERYLQLTPGLETCMHGHACVHTGIHTYTHANTHTQKCMYTFMNWADEGCRALRAVAL